MCNAGHPPPYRISPDGTHSALPAVRNPALGLLRGCQFATASCSLQTGDRLFFFTDGVTEAMNAGKELYTAQRLETVLAETRAISVESVAKAVISDVQNHTGTNDASDDITVLVVDFTADPGGNGAGPNAPAVPEKPASS